MCVKIKRSKPLEPQLGKREPEEAQSLPSRRAPSPRGNKAPGPTASPGCRGLQAAGWGPVPPGWRRPTGGGGPGGARDWQRRGTCCGGSGRARRCAGNLDEAAGWGGGGKRGSRRPRPLPAPGAAANGQARGGAEGGRVCHRPRVPGGAAPRPTPSPSPPGPGLIPAPHTLVHRYWPPRARRMCGLTRPYEFSAHGPPNVCPNPDVDGPDPERPWP